MQLTVKYQEVDWWFWALIGAGIGLGLLGLGWGFKIAFWVSMANLLYFIMRDRSVFSFPVQVREVWLAFVLLAYLPMLSWLWYLLFIGMVLVVFFDRCGIARVLVLMPWNKGVALK